MRATQRRWWRRTSRDARGAEYGVAEARRRDRAGRDLRADGGRDRSRVRCAAPRQLRLRAARDGRRLRTRARVAMGVAGVGRDRPLLRRRAGAVAPDGPARVPAPAGAVAGGDARRDVRGRVPPPERGPAFVRAAREDRDVARVAEPAGDSLRRRRPQDHDRRDRRRGGVPPRARRAARAHDGRAAHARGLDGFRHGTSARRARQPGDRRGGARLGRARRGRLDHADGADAARDARLRAPRHDRRARRRRRGRPEPPGTGHARRVRDRLRERDPRRRAADREQPVPAVVPVRRRDPRPARPPRRGLHALPRRRGARLRRDAVLELAGPAALVAAAALLGALVSASTEGYFTDALVKVAIVAALYVFIGNSGVLSFGHVSFVAVGAWTAGVLSVPASEKPAIMPNLAGFLGDRTVGNVSSLALAALAGGVCALVVALPLMRLSGLAAGIATFAVLEITHNVLRYYEPIGPGLNTFSSVPETTGLLQATIGALVAVVVAFAYQASRFGRQLRATREDPAAARAVGISVYRQRLLAFALSGAVAGFAGGLYVHLLPLTTEEVYLNLTFTTLAMLVIGGLTSLWGAVVGALAVGGLDSLLAEAENGISAFGRTIDLPAGSRIVVVGALMALVLIVRPTGLTGGREFRLWRAG